MTLAITLSALVVAAFGAWFVRRRRVPPLSWDAAVPVTDAAILDHIGVIYVEMVRRIAAVRPEAVVQQYWSRRLFVHPLPSLPFPYDGRWGVAFPEHADGGNAGGNLVILAGFLTHDALLRHEVAHLITRRSDHPDWLFGPDLEMRV